MRKSILTALTLAFAVPAGAAIWQAGDVSRFFAASASSGDLLQGCTDVPEAVALATELRDRALRIERYMEAMDTRKAEIATAEAALRARAFGMDAIHFTTPEALETALIERGLL